jgi:hypothetical protein
MVTKKTLKAKYNCETKKIWIGIMVPQKKNYLRNVLVVL